MSDPRPDEELIAIANKGGDSGQRAFEALYHRHRDWVYAMAMRFTHQHDLAMDVTQELFIYFLRKFPGFSLTAKLTTFFYPAIRNLAMTHRGKSQRFAGGDEAMLAVPDRSSPEIDDRSEMSAMLESLSEDHREVVLLRFVDGLSMQEIAAATRVPIGTAKSRLHHALALLRNDPRAQRYFESGQL